MEILKRHIRNGLLKTVVAVAAFAVILSIPAVINAADPAPIDLGNECTLKVDPISTSEAESGELEKNTVIDLYLIAKAVKVSGYDTYTYELEDDFSSLDLTKDWEQVAKDAGDIFFEKSSTLSKYVSGADAEKRIEELECGLYLVIARGRDVVDYIRKDEGVTVSQTAANNYLFSPSLVTFPTKAAVDGVINTANPVDWEYDLEITLKSSIEPRFGDLRIIKDLKTFKADEEATFLFTVSYGDVVKIFTLNFNNTYTNSTLVKHLPAGTEVTVKEAYDGLAYKPVGATEAKVTIVADDTVEVKFVNEYVPENGGGYGVLNTFTYGETGWQWDKKVDSSVKEDTAQ